MKKILCIGDSLALPRFDEVKYEDTWFYLLKKQFPAFDFISVFKRGITTDVLTKWGGGEQDKIKTFPYGSDCLEHYKPNVVILQLGIVDCAPRLLKQGIERKLVTRLPKKYRNIYINFLKKFRERTPTNTFVSIEKFEKNLVNYFERGFQSGVDKVILIEIPIPDQEMIKKNKNILSNVIKYNEVYNKLSKNYSFVECVAPLKPDKFNEKIYTDGYHSNKLGNNLVFQELKQILINE